MLLTTKLVIFLYSKTESKIYHRSLLHSCFAVDAFKYSIAIYDVFGVINTPRRTWHVNRSYPLGSLPVPGSQLVVAYGPNNWGPGTGFTLGC